MLRSVLVLAISLALLAAPMEAKKQSTGKRTRTEQASRPAKKQRSAGDVRREQKRTAGEIKQTQQQIDANKRETRRQLNALASLNAEISRSQADIASLGERVDSLAGRIGSLNDSLAHAEKRMAATRAAYARSLKAMRYRRRHFSPIAFVLGAHNMSDAWRRTRYLRELSAAHSAKAARMKEAAAELAARRAELESALAAQRTEMNRMEAARNLLRDRQTKADKMVASLRREGASLEQTLADKREQARRLDRELDRIIAEEQRKAREEEARKKAEAERKAREAAQAQAKNAASPAKPAANSESKPAAPAIAYNEASAASRALGGTFAANRGNLLFPVAGKYRIVSQFGRTNHPQLAGVEIQNSGIDIEAAGQPLARAVFDGEVTSVFRIDGYQNIVILRHGEYLTVYAGLDTIAVRKGDRVKAGQTVGHIFADPDDGGRAILHFELRHEKEKLNPSAWLRP